MRQQSCAQDQSTNTTELTTSPHAQLRVFILNSTILQKAKQVATRDPILQLSLVHLLNEANTFLMLKPVSVIEKTQIPPSGDKNDYLSLAPYYWPDPSKPKGLPYIVHDGLVNPKIYTVTDWTNLQNMIHRVSILSLAYYFTNNSQYASKAKDFLQAWFLNTHTRMNPNLQFAQMETGENNGSAAGIIDTHDFPEVIDSIGLIQRSPSWTAKEQMGMKQWFNQYLDWLLNSPFGKREAQETNNHGTWYDVQASSTALYLNKICLAKQIIQKSIDKRILGHIQASGGQPYELHRTKSWDYSLFNLQALFELANIGQHLGTDLWHYKTPEGVTLRTGLDYLLPKIIINQTWPYKQITPVNANGLGGLLYQAAIHYNDLSYIDDYNKAVINDTTFGQDDLLSRAAQLILSKNKTNVN
jgi:hypothetical protein